MSSLPKDPVMMLSVVNTALRDHFSSLNDLAENYEVSADDIVEKLAAIDYHYDPSTNQFK